jgi:uncharacterized protein YqeY
VVKTIDATVKKKKKKKKKKQQREEAGERSILDRSIAQQHNTIRQFGEGRKDHVGDRS